MMCVLYYGFYTQNQIDIWFCSWMKLFVVVAILEMRTNKQIHEMYKWHQSRNTKYTQVQFDLKIYSKIWKYHRYESFLLSTTTPSPLRILPRVMSTSARANRTTLVRDRPCLSLWPPSSNSSPLGWSHCPMLQITQTLKIRTQAL